MWPLRQIRHRKQVQPGKTGTVHQRTELINALRSTLYEYGHIVPQGIRQIGRIEEILRAPHSDLPDLMLDECTDLLEQITEQTARINTRAEKIKALAAEVDTARRLQTIPGGRADDGDGSRGICAVDGEFQWWPGLCSLAGFGSASILIGWQRTAGSHIQGWASKYSPIADHWCDVAVELDGTQIRPVGLVASANHIVKAAHARGDRLGQQDGSDNLGYAHETSGLSRFGAGRSSIDIMRATLPEAG